MKKKNYEEMPPITRRIKNIIDEKFDGNVRQFALSLGLDNSTKINRLFLKDKRNNDYPIPSTDLILLIASAFDISTDYLLKGEEKHVNNININTNKVNGDNNITNSNDVTTSNGNEYIEIIKKQQEQINTLLAMMMKKN